MTHPRADASTSSSPADAQASGSDAAVDPSTTDLSTIDPSTIDPSTIDPWALPRWVELVSVSLRGLLNAAGVLACAACCVIALQPWSGPHLPFVGALLAFPLIALGIAVHEGGHLVAARRAGMTVVQARIGWLLLVARRRGWQLRWCRPALRVGGLLLAYPDPDRPLRRQYALMTWGGPLANLFAAALLASAGTFATGSATWLLLAFAAINASVGLANLLPVRLPLPSDGLQLLALRDPALERHPNYRFQRVLGMCLQGMTPDRLPIADIEAIRAMEAPLPLVAEWLRLKAAQQRGEWAQALAIEADAAAIVDGLSPAGRAQIADLLALLRVETAFCRALLTGDPGAAAEPALTRDADLAAPHVAPRVRALHAALTGNVAAREYWLGLSEALAEESIDRSVATGEARLRQAVRNAGTQDG